MSARANEKGLYFVRGVPCHPSGASVAMMAQSGRFLNRDLPMPGTILNGGRLSATPEVMSEVAATNVNSRFVPSQGWTGDPRQRESLSVSLPSERESLSASLPFSERGSTSFPSTLLQSNTPMKEGCTLDENHKGQMSRHVRVILRLSRLTKG